MVTNSAFSPMQRIHAHAGNLFSAGRTDEAATYTRSMLRQFPGDPFLLNLSGAICVTRNDWPNALKYYQKAHKKLPDDAHISRNLAMAQQMLGQLAQAEKTLRTTLSRKPEFAEGWNILGAVYQEKQQPDKAMACYRKALRIQPDFLNAAANILMETESLNDLDGLRDVLKMLEEKFPGQAIVDLCRGMILFREKDFGGARDCLSGISFKTGILDRQRQMELSRETLLAKALDKLGDFTQAFEMFTRVNTLSLEIATLPESERTEFRDRLQAHLTYFTAEKVARWPKLAANASSPAFMVGFPRSGTTLLDTFLRGHKDISVVEEQPCVPEMVDSLGIHSLDTLTKLETLSRDRALKAAQNYLKSLRKHGGNSRVIVDRSPFNTVMMGEVLRIFPNAKFILAVRDPADVVLSCFMQAFTINSANATLTTPLDAARTYDSTMELWVRYTGIFDVDTHICRYEDVVQDPATTLPPLIDFLGLDWDPQVLEHQKTARKRERINTASYAQVVQPIYQSSVRRWENYAELMPEALEILAPWREYFGYD